ncbi:MAG: hypothetical protein ACFFFH_09120 [Candidatus Thorarchaeota archaeon]
MTIQIGNLASHGSKIILKQDAFYFIDRLNSFIQSILLSKGDKKFQVYWWDDENYVKEYNHYWGNYIFRQVDRKTIEEYSSSYIDLNVTHLQLSEPKEIEPALTELQTYKAPSYQ